MFWNSAILLIGLTMCRATPIGTDGRIVNGSDADIKDFPFMVSVKILSVHACGGTILDEYNVLTAAHCIFSIIPPSLYTVQYGTSNISGGSTIRVENYTVNEEYAGYTESFNDIAVLHLSSPIPLGNDVQPVELPAESSPTPENADAVLIGWGLEKSFGSFQHILQRVNIELYSGEECQNIYNSTNSRYQLCAGVPEGGKGQCEGDSGGPLLVNGIEVGIVSWSRKPCASKGNPGVFTKVSTYTDWIKSHLKVPTNKGIVS